MLIEIIIILTEKKEKCQSCNVESSFYYDARNSCFQKSGCVFNIKEWHWHGGWFQGLNLINNNQHSSNTSWYHQALSVFWTGNGGGEDAGFMQLQQPLYHTHSYLDDIYQPPSKDELGHKVEFKLAGGTCI